jgi:hypothetical protein
MQATDTLYDSLRVLVQWQREFPTSNPIGINCRGIPKTNKGIREMDYSPEVIAYVKALALDTARSNFVCMFGKTNITKEMLLSTEDLFKVFSGLYEIALTDRLNGIKPDATSDGDCVFCYGNVEYVLEIKAFRSGKSDITGSANNIGRLHVAYWGIEDCVTTFIPYGIGCNKRLRGIHKPPAYMRHS